MKTAEEILEERKNTHGDFEKGAVFLLELLWIK